MQRVFSLILETQKDSAAQSGQEALAHVEVVYNCCLLLQDVMNNLEDLEEEHGLEECKLLRRAKALLQFITGDLDNSTNDMRWQISGLLNHVSEQNTFPEDIPLPRFSLFETVQAKDTSRTLELCGMNWNSDPTAGKLGWWYNYGDGSSSVHESSLVPIKPAQDSPTNTNNPMG